METTEVRKREAEAKGALLPLVRAESFTRCQLYWIPVGTWPARRGERDWLNQFFDRLSATLAEERELRAEVFLQMQTLQPEALTRTFLQMAPELNPVFGLMRRLSGPQPKPPDMRDIKKLQDGEKTFRFGDYMADYCYWFIRKQEQKVRRAFLGYGGLTILHMKPDPKAVPPPVKVPGWLSSHPAFGKIPGGFNPERMMQESASLGDAFLNKSKDIFGKGMEEEPEFPGLLYILPLLCTQDFFAQPEDAVKGWFELFEVYVGESPQDQGMILAASFDIQPMLIAVVSKMREEGLAYPV